LFVQVYLGLFPNGITENSFAMFALQFLLEAVFFAAAITVAISKKVNIAATGIKKRFNAKLVLIGFGISVVCLYGFGSITSVFLSILQMCGYKSVLGAISINTFWQYLGYVIASCVAPAVFEELLFRGTILSGLKEFGIKTAIIVSALIFTFMHGNPEQTVHQFIIGAVVGYIFFKSGNLWLGIIVHFFNNFISVTQAYVVSLFAEPTTIEATSKIAIVDFVVDVVIAAILAYVGYEIVKWLIQKMLVEDAKLNGVTEKVEEQQTILVDGQEVVADVVVEGADNVVSSDMANASGTNVANEKQPISASTIVCFAVTACYLLYEWIGYLLVGLGVV
jgi:membrane protease YdiL (CAAX protease family)